jgi:hypothetical protein
LYLCVLCVFVCLWELFPKPKQQDAIPSDSRKDDSKGQGNGPEERTVLCRSILCEQHAHQYIQSMYRMFVLCARHLSCSSLSTKGDEGCMTTPNILPRNLPSMYRNKQALDSNKSKCSHEKHLWR